MESTSLNRAPATPSGGRTLWRRGLQGAQPVLTIVVALIAWEGVARLFAIPVWMLPPPSLVLQEFVARADEFPAAIFFTLRTTLSGFGLAMGLGILLAIVVVYSRFLRNSILPLLIVSQAIPKIALAPLLLIWVGYGEATIVSIAFLVAFFPVVVNTATGMQNVEPELLDLSSSLSAGRLQTFRRVVFPSAVPFIFSGAKVAVTLALIGAVIGEFVASDQGLGHIVILSSAYLQTSRAFGAIMLLALMGIALFYTVQLIERIFFPWATKGSEVLESRAP